LLFLLLSIITRLCLCNQTKHSLTLHSIVSHLTVLIGGLPTPAAPHITWHTLADHGLAAFVIALLSFLETIAIGKVFAKQNGYAETLSSSQEMLACGVSNIVGSFLHCIPATGSFSRTAVNSQVGFITFWFCFFFFCRQSFLAFSFLPTKHSLVMPSFPVIHYLNQAGVRTPASGVVVCAIVVLALYVATPAFFYIPSAALAALIIVAVVSMLDVSLVRQREFVCVLVR
jgi:sodium-independent sulfate anion transporter 11